MLNVLFEYPPSSSYVDYTTELNIVCLLSLLAVWCCLCVCEFMLMVILVVNLQRHQVVSCATSLERQLQL